MDCGWREMIYWKKLLEKIQSWAGVVVQSAGGVNILGMYKQDNGTKTVTSRIALHVKDQIFVSTRSMGKEVFDALDAEALKRTAKEQILDVAKEAMEHVDREIDKIKPPMIQEEEKVNLGTDFGKTNNFTTTRTAMKVGQGLNQGLTGTTGGKSIYDDMF